MLAQFLVVFLIFNSLAYDLMGINGACPCTSNSVQLKITTKSTNVMINCLTKDLTKPWDWGHFKFILTGVEKSNTTVSPLTKLHFWRLVDVHF